MGEIVHGRDFGDSEYLSSASIYDSRGCLFFVGLKADDYLYLSVQGSQSPYNWSPEQRVEAIECQGTPSIAIYSLEEFSIICAKKNNEGIAKWRFNPFNFPDPA
jgi:hypothetical protein